MGDAVTVVSFLWGSWCYDWAEEYVWRMAGMLRRQMTCPYRYVVFSDRGYISKDPQLPDWIQLPDFVLNDMPGNMKKLYVYHPLNGLSGRILMVDLDMVFTGKLTPFTNYTGRWCAPDNLGGGSGLAGGGLVSFRKPACQWMWTLGWKTRKGFLGKERFFYRRYMSKIADTWQKECPEMLYSYKWHVKKHGLPSNCRVVHFHGRPRPHEVVEKEPFLQKHWGWR